VTGGLTPQVKLDLAHIRDLSFTTGTTNGGNALTLNLATSVASPAYTANSDVYNVTIRGDDGYSQTDFWSTELSIQNVSNVNVENGNFEGAAGGHGNGINIVGLPASSTFAVVLNVAKSAFNNLSNGLIYGTFVQGVTIDQSNFTGDTNGIISSASETGLAQLTVTNSQIATFGAGIATLSAIPGTMISNNLFIALGSGVNAINLVAANSFSITGNVLTSTTATSTNGIVIGTVSGKGGMITGNTISGFTTGIALGATSTNTAAVSNSITLGNTVAISNSGTGNTITPNYN
jgi:hypothetical protein